MKDVTPLPPCNRISKVKPLHRILPGNTAIAPLLIADHLSDNLPEGDVQTEFLRPGISRMILRKLRRGYWKMQDTLDLHGFHSDEARKQLLEFLHEVTERNLRYVCVIHGKGWQTGGREGLLKSHVRHWLPQCSEVLAFCETPQNAGGGGAVWILLRATGKSSDHPK